MQLPVIHLNGSSREHLLDVNVKAHVLLTAALEANNKAREALRAAANALSQASPNLRDYYPLGDAAGIAALQEHAERASILRKVEREQELHCLAIDAVATELAAVVAHLQPVTSVQ
jgi:hypothetical protein